MKQAFAHCRLLPWWAQVVLEDMISQSKSNHIQIFTLLSNQTNLKINNKKINITTVLPRWINNFLLRSTSKNIPLVSSLFDYRNLIILAPLRAYIMSRQIKRYWPEEICISSFAWSKNINTYGIPANLYLHSPMQYIWTHEEEYKKKLHGRKWYIFSLCTKYLKPRDKKQRTYSTVVANSKYTAHWAKKIYKIEAKVQYPTISHTILQQQVQKEHQNYLIYAWRLVSFVKELDIIIQACNITQTPLIIMWDGPDKEKLQKIAGDTIIFIPWIQDINKRIQTIQNAQWMINITKESFGISTIESLLLWVPVLWYNDGASTELIDKDSGLLIKDKELKTIAAGIDQFRSMTFDKKNIQDHARMLYKNNHKETIFW